MSMETEIKMVLVAILLSVVVVCVIFKLLWDLPDWIAERRIRTGKCARCAYDLHQCTTRTCPECGMEF